jgi:amino acid permease
MTTPIIITICIVVYVCSVLGHRWLDRQMREGDERLPYDLWFLPAVNTFVLLCAFLYIIIMYTQSFLKLPNSLKQFRHWLLNKDIRKD